MKKEYGGADAPFLRAFLIGEKLGVKDYLIFLVDTRPTICQFWCTHGKGE